MIGREIGREKQDATIVCVNIFSPSRFEEKMKLASFERADKATIDIQNANWPAMTWRKIGSLSLSLWGEKIAQEKLRP